MDKRSYFRLSYPKPERPKLVMLERTFDVVELSEGGARIEIAESIAHLCAVSFFVMIDFRTDKRIYTNGSLLREGDGFAVVQFRKLIPQELMFEEQRRLLGKYANQ